MLDQGFTPQRVTVDAGGSIDLAPCRSQWSGWVAAAMNIQISYRSSGSKSLTIAIESKIDTILLVNDPAAAWHYDDDGGTDLNGKLTFPRAREGRYDIWVGTYDRGQAAQVIVVITEE